MVATSAEPKKEVKPEEKVTILTSAQQVQALVVVIQQQKALLAVKEAEAAANGATTTMNMLQSKLCKDTEELKLNADNTQVICSVKTKDPESEKTK